MLRKIALLFLLLFVTFGASALHEIRPAYLQIKQLNDSVYEVYWKVPSLGKAIPKINPVFTEGIEVKDSGIPNFTGGFAIFTYRISSSEPLAGSLLMIQGLNRTLIDTLVTINYTNGETITLMLQPDKDSVIIPGESKLSDIVKTYTILGIEHILLGFDHLLFVLALILIVNSNWKVIKTVTAFTVAHSITLSAAALGWVFIPGPPVEAVIALSIVFLALEIVTNLKGKETLTSRQPWIVAFVFGLLHGFGFAGALQDIGLPQQNIPWALGFFNVGVELGQIAFIIVIILLTKMFSLKKDWPKALKLIPAYIIGSLACFWLIDRVVGFWI